MRLFSRRFVGAVLLPLLILSSWVNPGGWYCADGSFCEPAVAATCCCDSAESGAVDGCRAEALEPARFAGTPCGCYYHLQASDLLLTIYPAHENGDLAPLSSALISIVPPVPVALLPPTTSPPGPPRHLVSPRDTRAPPAV